MSKKTKKPEMSKMDFVREHANLLPAEIAAKAKAQGIAISPKMVSVYKHTLKKRAEKRSAATKTTTKPTMSGFIRENIAMPTEKLIALGKSKGFTKINAKAIYNARSVEKNRKAHPRAAMKRSSTTFQVNFTPANGLASTQMAAEDRLRGLAAEIGLGRAIEVLRTERGRVLRLIED